MFKIEKLSAHCDIPCAVYDPSVAQYAALSVVRFLDLIGEMSACCMKCGTLLIREIVLMD